MPSTDLHGQARTADAAARTLEDTIRGQLEQRRREVADEIRHYPTPIAGCDQHFNWLLERQQGLRAQVQRLDEICASTGTAEDREARLAAFDLDAQPHEAYPHDTVHSH